jgi:hypothetical protein
MGRKRLARPASDRSSSPVATVMLAVRARRSSLSSGERTRVASSGAVRSSGSRWPPSQLLRVHGREGLKLPRLAEDGPPLRASRAELLFWRERQVELEPAGQQEHADDRRRGAQVPVMNRAEIVAEPSGPPVHRCGELSADGEHQVGVRPAVAVPGGKRAGERGAGDGFVSFGTREQLFPDAVPVSGGEHRSRAEHEDAARGAAALDLVQVDDDRDAAAAEVHLPLAGW